MDKFIDVKIQYVDSVGTMTSNFDITFDGKRKVDVLTVHVKALH